VREDRDRADQVEPAVRIGQGRERGSAIKMEGAGKILGSPVDQAGIGVAAAEVSLPAIAVPSGQDPARSAAEIATPGAPVRIRARGARYFSR
jgi:hypothetical protein